jgi:hypothetical protein
VVSEPGRVRELVEREKMSSGDENEKKAAAAKKAFVAAAEGSGKPLMMMPRSSSVPIQYPMLNDTNYMVWAAKMKFIL